MSPSLKEKAQAQYFQDEEVISGCFAFVVFCLFLTNIAGGLQALIGIPHEIISMLLKILIFIKLIISLGSILRRLDAKLICTVILLANFFLLNAVIFPENFGYIQGTLTTYVTTCFPMFALAYMIDDHSILEKKLLTSSRWIALLATLLFILIAIQAVPGFNNNQYSMGYGYALLIPMLMLFVSFWERRRALDVVLCVGLLLSILSLGSRGPVLAAAVFVVIYLSRKNIPYFLFTATLILLLAVYFQDILEFLVDQLKKWGLESRTLYLFLEGRVHLSAGRDAIYDDIKDAILRNPAAVRGINAEFAEVGTYAHNILLELIYQYGIFFGSGLCICVFVLAISEIRGKNNSIRLIYMCVSILHLMVSSSVWVNISFWVWMGFVVRNTVGLYEKRNG